MSRTKRNFPHKTCLDNYKDNYWSCYKQDEKNLLKKSRTKSLRQTSILKDCFIKNTLKTKYE